MFLDQNICDVGSFSLTRSMHEKPIFVFSWGFLCIDDQKKLLPPVGLNCTKLELEGKCEDLLTDIWKSIDETGAPEKVKVLDVCIDSCKQCVGNHWHSISFLIKMSSF